MRRYCRRHDFHEIICPKCVKAVMDALTKLERKVDSLEGTVRLMARLLGKSRKGAK